MPQTRRPKKESPIQTLERRFEDLLIETKADVDGGLVIFRLQTPYFVVFNQDAEIVAAVLGVVAFPAHAGGPRRIIIAPESLRRVLSQVRAAGHDDIWLYDQRPSGPKLRPIDECGQPTLPVLDAIRQLLAS